jgi:hypothetical protein
VNQEGSVGFEHQEAYRFGEPGSETTRVKDLAASDEQTHLPGPYCPFRTVLSYAGLDALRN